MKSNEYCECYDDIDSHHDLFDIIKGRNNQFDIRENCIFRGLENDSYRLEPSSMRNNGEELNKFISNDEMLPFKLNEKSEVGFVPKKKFSRSSDASDNYLNLTNTIHNWKEFYVLMKFIDIADKNGLKINVDERIRRILDLKSFEVFFKRWPEQILWENIALAQHYGIPTKFLDWSYDYKVSTYFAVKDIIKEKTECEENDEKSDGVLWAFNYKLFNEMSHFESKEQFKLQFYRAEYSSNPNLSAQKGLFTFFVNKTPKESFGEFHKIIINQFKENDKLSDKKIVNGSFNRVHSLKTSDIPEDEKVFYKFTIPYDLKRDILKELIKENNFTDKLFPGYSGVVESIRNKVILDEL